LNAFPSFTGIYQVPGDSTLNLTLENLQTYFSNNTD